MSTEVQGVNSMTRETVAALVDLLNAETRFKQVCAMLRHPSVHGNEAAASLLHRSVRYTLEAQRAARAQAVDMLTTAHIIQPGADYLGVSGTVDDIQIRVHYSNGDNELLFWHRP